MILPGVSHYLLQKEVYKQGREQATLTNTKCCIKSVIFLFVSFFGLYKEESDLISHDALQAVFHFFLQVTIC